MKKLTWLLAVALSLAGCIAPTDELPPAPRQAYVPVYRMPDNIYTTAFTAPSAMKEAGKQYVFGSLLLQNDMNEGIHLYNISNPSAPVKLGFLDIPLCTEMSIRQGFLYTNNFADLLVYDLRGSQPTLVKRIKDVFPPVNQQYPPLFNVAFECPDPKKGVVVRWELKQNITTTCRR
ncbi:MAG TPA: hypothetical protein VK907_06705 [Phnomibacter sp.]|nr:hypothetical protein [Phnomibacter sp.]